jgi:hypothetical protein
LKLLKSNVPEEKWGEQWKLPSPNMVLILDEDDSLRSVQLLAERVHGSSTSVSGEAIVEEGRARGVATLKPQKFFEHNYKAEISFDVPLLASTAAPRKLLENVPRLENGGRIVMAGRTVVLPHVVAYTVRDSSGSATHVLLTEKPIDSSKVLASLRQSGEVGLSLIGFQSHVNLTLDENDLLRFMSAWCDGASINWSGNDNVQSHVQSEGDHIRGTSKTVAKQDVLGKSFEFQASFDTTILRVAESK